MRSFIYILIIFIILFSCTTHKEESTVVIRGSFPAYTQQWIYLDELDIRQSLPIDSVKNDDSGNFNFSLQLQEPGFYVLKTNPDNFIILQLDLNENVLVSSENINFSKGYSVSGSKGSELLCDFETFSYHQKQKLDSLADIFYSSQSSTDFLNIKRELDTAYMKLFDAQKKYVKDFIEQNSGSLSSLIVLNRKFGQNKVLDETEDYFYFAKVDSALMESKPRNKHTKDHHRRVTELKGKIFDKRLVDEKLKPGKKAPDIVVKDTSGNFISLKNLKGQRVLVYFWAGWNAKSRQDNRLLMTRYPEFKARNIEILGVSLDEHEQVWMGAVKLDKLPWLNGSDLMGLNSPVAKEYNLDENLPYYFLVDEDGKIVHRSKDVLNIIGLIN
ncbi:MAG: redoxin domain-containing protein [Bacteroidales bacterium]|nr:redoxin domain-containing protein [Bacteroidales bacterium]